MSNNVKVLIVGTGNIAKEYCKILLAQGYEPLIIGRSEEKAKLFAEEMKLSVLSGGVECALSELKEVPKKAIVAVNIEQLACVTKFLVKSGVTDILVEKPAALERKELEEVCDLVMLYHANVYVAYNRRFYASTNKALEIIKEDGGVTSFNFEFTEWGHVVRNSTRPKEIKENWFLANSTHVVDLAFFLGGYPKEMVSYVSGSLDWHSKASTYAGAGISEKNALFSYQANWSAPGRWAVEVLTNKHRLYLKPMEKLQIQEIGSVVVDAVEIDDEIDQAYKPGFYAQTKSFLENINDGKKLTIEEQLKHFEYYEKMENVSEV